MVVAIDKSGRRRTGPQILWYAFIPVWLASADISFAQNSITLDTVRITERAQRPFTVGRSGTTLDSAQLQTATLLHLGQTLEQFTAIAIRNYGNGMSSVLSVRGTGPGHTVVNWNGFSINSPMLGLQDLSLIQSIAYDQVAIQWGATNTLVGTDAVSGAVLLTSKPVWRVKHGGRTSAQFGSFGRKGLQFSTHYGSSQARWAGRTAISWLGVQNDFPYRNTSRFGQPTERQQHARIRQISAVQDIYGKLSNRYYLSLNSWYTSADRDLQPGIGIKGTETQQDNALRLVLSLVGSHNQHSSLVQFAHSYEQILYTNPVSALNELSVANQTQFRLEEQWNLFTTDAKWHVKTGLEAARSNALVPAYQTGQTQWRGDLYSLVTFEKNRLRVSGQFRKGWITGFDPPVIPSLGADYRLGDATNRQLTAKMHISRVYRVPTLNDRYWRPGGNADLRPETGWSQEGGLLLSNKSNAQRQDRTVWEASATVYHALISDWILWRPGQAVSYWSAQNLQQVRSRGLETAFRYMWSTPAVSVTSQLSLNYNRVSSEKIIPGTEPVMQGNQLMYAPKIIINQSNRLVFKNWEFGIQESYVSRRYTLIDNSAFLPGYVLLNAQLSKQLSWKKQLLTFMLSGYNLTNSIYQTVENRAMPGINYNLTVTFKFN